MPTYSVQIDNLKPLQAALKKFPEIAEKNLQKAVNASAAEIIKQAVRPTVPFKTGNLVHSFGTIYGRLFANVAPDRSTPASYAIFVHEGTKPHMIFPKTAKALYWPGAAHPVKKVSHPGTKPNRFMPRILEKAGSNIKKHFQASLDLITKEIAK